MTDTQDTGTTNSPPHPGSPAAIELGCVCPVMDNNNGKGIPWPNRDGKVVTAFWMDWTCPLHGNKDHQAE